VGVIGDERKPQAANFLAMPGVEQALAITKPFKLASREFSKEDTIVYVGRVRIGGGSMAMIAGPCAVENYETMDTVARYVKAGGANILRGGAFNYDARGLRATNRVHHPGRFRLVMAGFRCAKDF